MPVMNDEMLGAAITRAERAARAIADAGLREKAFEVILNRLLEPERGRGNDWETTRADVQTAARPSRQADYLPKREPKTLPQRILALQAEGFFREPRSIGSVREGLGSRGWRYPVTTLSGALQGLIRKRSLRRERVREGQKTPWKYSNP
jgi:hypothetical protein